MSAFRVRILFALLFVICAGLGSQAQRLYAASFLGEFCFPTVPPGACLNTCANPGCNMGGVNLGACDRLGVNIVLGTCGFAFNSTCTKNNCAIGYSCAGAPPGAAPLSVSSATGRLLND